MSSKLHFLSPQKRSQPKAAARVPVARHQVQMHQLRQHVALDMIVQLVNTQLRNRSESREERIIQW